MSIYGGRRLGSMSMRDLEDGGLRFYERKGIMNGEQRDDDGWSDEDQWDFALSDLEPPAETITERDMHPAHWEGVEGYEPSQDDHDQAELMYVDPAERVW